MRMLIVLTVVLAGCGSGGGSSSNSAQGQKALFSTWYDSQNQLSLNLSNAHFGTAFGVVYVLGNGANCTATMLINGNDTAGSASISGSHWTGGGGSDPGCATINNSYTYSNSNGTLVSCAQQCQSFQ